MNLHCVVAVSCLMFSMVSPVLGQGGYNPEAMLGPQREAMKKLAHINGVWRGPAWTILPNGQKHHITQTERIGPFLDGTLKVIEGRGYEPDGRVTFNAFGVISYDLQKKQYMMRSYAQGYSGDFELKMNETGYSWEVPAGPGMTIRYAATIKDGVWKEVGDRIVKDKEPVRFFEMELKRIGDSDWPSAGTIPPK
ncbi:MAG: hypothetical protein QM703_11595 [Gemmatales bacterium]